MAVVGAGVLLTFAAAPAFAAGQTLPPAGIADAAAVKVAVNPDLLASVDVSQLPIYSTLKSTSPQLTQALQTSLAGATASVEVALDLAHADGTLPGTSGATAFQVADATSQPVYVKAQALQAQLTALSQLLAIVGQGGLPSQLSGTIVSTLTQVSSELGADVNSLLGTGQFVAAIPSNYDAAKTTTDAGKQVAHVANINGIAGVVSTFAFAPYTADAEQATSSAENTTESLAVGANLPLVSSQLSSAAEKIAALNAQVQGVIQSTPAGGTVTNLTTTLGGQVQTVLGQAPTTNTPVDNVKQLAQELTDLQNSSSAAADALNLADLISTSGDTSLTTVAPTAGSTIADASTKVANIQIITIKNATVASLLGYKSGSSYPLAIVEGAEATAHAHLIAPTSKNLDELRSASSHLSKVTLLPGSAYTTCLVADDGTSAGEAGCTALGLGTATPVNAGPFTISVTRGAPVLSDPKDATMSATNPNPSSSASITALDIKVTYTGSKLVGSITGPQGQSVPAAQAAANAFGTDPQSVLEVQLATASARSGGVTPNGNTLGAHLPRTGNSIPLAALLGVLVLSSGLLVGFGPRMFAWVRAI
ncbi:MAG: hypothetical protein ACYDAY_09770 [Candidatus Dormibacteria bacterium]